MTIGEKVKKLRIEQGLTQKELAEKCGYGSLSAINKIELGLSTPPLASVEQLAKALGVSPAYLTGWEYYDNTNENRENIITEKRLKALGFDIDTLSNLSTDDLKKIADTLNILVEGVKAKK